MATYPLSGSISSSKRRETSFFIIIRIILGALYISLLYYIAVLISSISTLKSYYLTIYIRLTDLIYLSLISIA